jgi:hypothetical protein
MQLQVAPCGAGGAAPDVPVQLPAERDGEPPVPAGQHPAQLAAVALPGAGYGQRPQAGLELAAGAGSQRVRLAACHAEHGRGLGGRKALPQLKLDDLTLARCQARGRGIEQAAQPGTLGVLAHAGGAGRRLWRPGRRGHRPAGPRDPPALAARHGVQPGPEPVRFAQARQPGGGDDERGLHRVGGLGRLTEQRQTVLIERAGVPVVGLGEPGALQEPECDGCDNLAVVHGETVAMFYPQCCTRDSICRHPHPAAQICPGGCLRDGCVPPLTIRPRARMPTEAGDRPVPGSAGRPRTRTDGG